MRTRFPITLVSPMTTPVPWSMKNFSPIRAPGWMSMPVRAWACSVMIRGISGTPRTWSSWAIRWLVIAIEGRLHVAREQPADRRHLREEAGGDALRGLRAVIAGEVVVPLDESDRAPHLLLQRAHRALQRRAEEVVQALRPHVGRPEVAGEEDRSQILDDLDDRVARRE